MKYFGILQNKPKALCFAVCDLLGVIKPPLDIFQTYQQSNLNN